MKRLAVFLPDFAGGGAERSLIAIAGKVAATGVQVAVVVARDTGPLRGSVPADVSIVALNARRTATSVLQLARFLRAWRPDAVLTGITHSNLTAIAAARLARSPATLVVTEHTDMRAARARPENRRSRILPALVRRLYPRADAVVAVSAGVADGLASEAGIARAAIRVIFNPVDCAAITAAAQERLTVPLGEAGVPLVAAVGRLHPDKRLDVLVRVVARINDTSPVSLAICGEGETRDALEPLIAALGMEHRIRLLGFLQNPYPVVAAASVLALTSRREGLPTVLLEAACLNVPIVATDCPSGPREILESIGEGHLVPLGDDAALEAALRSALRGDRGPTGFRPDADAADRFRADALFGDYLELLGLI